MDLEEYKEKKAAMERKMAALLAKIVADFERETGMTPNNVSVYMAEKTTVGDSRRQYVVAKVTTDIEI